MGERENNLEIGKSYLERAHSKLRSAKILLNEKAFDDSISRSYYAVHLATQGILLILGETPRSHSGLITVFGLKVVKTGLISKEYAKILTNLFDARQASDYNALVWYEETDTKDYLIKAEKFVKRIDELFESLVSSDQ